jgi:hypothetical protein
LTSKIIAPINSATEETRACQLGEKGRAAGDMLKQLKASIKGKKHYVDTLA